MEKNNLPASLQHRENFAFGSMERGMEDQGFSRVFEEKKCRRSTLSFRPASHTTELGGFRDTEEVMKG